MALSDVTFTCKGTSLGSPTIECTHWGMAVQVGGCCCSETSRPLKKFVCYISTSGYVCVRTLPPHMWGAQGAPHGGAWLCSPPYPSDQRQSPLGDFMVICRQCQGTTLHQSCQILQSHQARRLGFNRASGRWSGLSDEDIWYTIGLHLTRGFQIRFPH